MKLKPLLFAGAVVLAAPLAAHAQAVNSAPATDQTAPSASDASAPASATFRDPNAPLGSVANPIPQSSPTPADQAYRLKAGDPTVITNGPIPDTPENRAKYGQPLSRTGRATPADGN